ncbi:hypothetical protein Back2_11810 [Nocardioides baekrokdamisoli]|uniref:SAF domain-containing protein n=1 Tax=Nocardioides baekrokdamisoli TaxID=1804624 RepID=A0A3G9J0A9_9ACTN|nr:hypothetical protein [Nocardioides baekrokdamisoli]BBH16894.1 hypothetical protein Back2_11810 [Nocardioides baekrokdamisoli]
MFSRPWFALLRRQVLIHRRSLAFCLTVAAVLLGWAAFVARPPTVSTLPTAVMSAPASPSPRPGYVRLPVRFADGEMAGLLHPGDRIQLWASDPRTQRSRQISRDAEVIEVAGAPSIGVSAGRQGRLVVIRVHVTEVERVTSFNSGGVLSYVLGQ